MDHTHEFDLLCIGSGPAGQRAAVQAATLRKRVAIVEREMDIGGVCLHTGTIPFKTFREAVLSFSKSRDGLANGHGGGLHSTEERATAEKLLARVSAIVLSETRIQRDQLLRNGIDVIPASPASAARIRSSSTRRAGCARSRPINC